MTPQEAIEACQAFRDSILTNPSNPNLPVLLQKAICGAKTIRRAISEVNNRNVIHELVQKGHLKLLLFLLDTPHYCPSMTSSEDIGYLQFEAAWCLTNVSATDSVPAIMNEPESLDILGRACMSIHPNVREHTIWCIGNICGYSPARRRNSNPFRIQILKDVPTMKGLVHNICEPANPSILKQTLWTIGNIMQGPFDSSAHGTICGVLDLVWNACRRLCLSVEIEEVDRKECLNEVYYAIQKSIHLDSVLAEHVGKMESFIPVTVRILQQIRGAPDETSLCIVCRIVRCIGNLLDYGDKAIVDFLLETDFLREFRIMLEVSNRNDHVWKDVCWSLSYLLDGSPERIRAFRRAQCLEAVVTVAHIGTWQAKEYALATLFLFLKHTNQIGHRHFFQTNAGLTVLCDSLVSTREIYPSLTMGALEAIDKLLLIDSENDKELEVKDRLWELQAVHHIEQLQNHPVNEVANMSERIIVMHFMDDDGDGEDEADLAGTPPDLLGDSFGQSDSDGLD